VKKLLAVLLLSVMVLGVTGAAWAEDREPATPELTIEEAVEMALKNSKKIMSSKISIDAAYETRQQASRYAFGFTASNDFYEDTAAMRYLASLQRADVAWQINRKSQILLEDSITFAAHQVYYKLLQEIAAVNQYEIEKKDAELQRTVAQARFKVGLLQQLDMERVEVAVVTANSNLDKARESLAYAYINFNYLVGLWPNDRPILTEVPEYEQLEVINLNNFIERSLTDNPSIWQKEKSVDLARYAVEGFNFNDPQAGSYRVKELELDQAILSAADAKDEARKKLKELYYDIRKTEEQLPVLEQSIKLSKESLRVISLRYEAGMATRSEVVSAETALAKVEKSMLDLVCGHDLQKKAFTKPWVMAMASQAPSQSGD